MIVFNMSSSTDAPQVGFATTGTTQSLPQMSRNKSNDLMSSTTSKEKCLSSSLERLNDSRGEIEGEYVDQKHNNRSHSLATPASSLAASVETILEKIEWASEQLKTSRNVERNTQLCNMLKACAEALTAIKGAQSVCVSCKRMKTDAMELEK